MYIKLPGSSAVGLRQITGNLKECGAEVSPSEESHKKVSYLITSNSCIKKEKREKLTSKKLLTDQSSRGAMFLARATYNQNKVSIFEKANSLGTNVVCLDDIGVHMSRKPELHGSSRTKQNTAQDREKLGL